MPVLGAPWSAPFEFPIYQYLVAFISAVAGADLVRTGRLTSYAFSLASLVPVAIIFRRLFPEDWRCQLACFAALFLTSPLYLFWGRSFLIETAALFFSLCFVASAIPLAGLRPKAAQLAGCSFFLTLAILQKITTVIPLYLLVCGVIAYGVWRKRSSLQFGYALSIGLALLVPLVIGMAWVRYSDHYKAEGLLTAWLTSNQLRQFNYGLLSDRLRPRLYLEVLWLRVMLPNAGGIVGLILLGAATVFGKSRQRLAIGLSLSALLLPFLLFEHLHVVHNYYQTAIALFGIAAVSMSASFLAGMSKQARVLSTVALALVATLNLAFFQAGYRRLEMATFGPETRTLALGRAIGERTNQEQSVLVFGYDWSSEIPFYSQRRAIAVPTGKESFVLQNLSKLEGEFPVGAVVYCPTPGLASSLISGRFPEFRSEEIGGCELYSRPDGPSTSRQIK